MFTADSTATPIVTITRYTIKGYVKERVLLVVFLFAFILMISSYTLAPLAVGAQRKIIIDIGLASISLFGILLVILWGASSYMREKDKGILPSLLSKPISRVDFILGKFMGTAITITMVMLFMSLVYVLVMFLSQTQINEKIFLAIYLSVVEVALITSIMTFFSSFTSPLLSSFFTMCVFISGNLSKDLLGLADQWGSEVFRIVASIGYYILPNLPMFNIRSEAVHDLALPDGFVYSATIYGIFYIVVMLFISSLIFRARDVT